MTVQVRLLLILRSRGAIVPDRALKDASLAKQGRVSKQGRIAQHCVVLDKLGREY